MAIQDSSYSHADPSLLSLVSMKLILKKRNLRSPLLCSGLSSSQSAYMLQIAYYKKRQSDPLDVHAKQRPAERLKRLNLKKPSGNESLKPRSGGNRAMTWLRRVLGGSSQRVRLITMCSHRFSAHPVLRGDRRTHPRRQRHGQA